MDRALIPYKRRLWRQALISAACWGLLAASALALTVLMLWHAFALKPMPAGAAALGGIGLFFLTTALILRARMWVTPEKTARVLDGLGLEERISTMLANRNDDSLMSVLQREDALSRLEKVSPYALAVHVPRRTLAIALGLTLLLAGTNLLPYGLLQPRASAPVGLEPGERQSVLDMLDDLRGQVVNSALTDEQKEALLRQLEEIAAQTDGGQTAVQIMVSMGAVKEELILSTGEGPVENSTSVIARMIRYGFFRELCEAMLIPDRAGIKKACGDLGAKLTSQQQPNRRAAVQNICDAIREIEDTTQESDTDGDLIPILSDLDYALLNAVQQPEGEEAEKQAIAEALDGFCEALLDRMAQEGNDEAADGPVPSGQEGTGNRTTGTESGETLSAGDQLTSYGSAGVTGLGNIPASRTSNAEIMYEPTMDASQMAEGTANQGLVPYDSVYGIYYARMLEKLADDDIISERLRRALEAYFAGI